MMINEKDIQKAPISSSIQNAMIIIIIIILTFTLEWLLRSYFSDLSNQLLSYIQYNKEADYWLFSLNFYMKLLGHRIVYYAIIIIIFNRENIYKPFCLLNLMFSSAMLNGFMQLLYAQLHPYTQSTHDIPLIQTFRSNYSSYAFPSDSLLIAPVFYFSVLKMYVSNKGELVKRKIIGTILICLIVSLISLGEYFLGYSSISQIIFSIHLSALMYYTMYYVLKINYTNASREFHSLLKYPIKGIILLNVFLLLLMLLLYYFRPASPQEAQEAKKSFCSFFTFFGNITLYFSLRLELVYYFQNSFNNWSQYNFDPQGEKQITGNTLLNKISISRGVQWNRTVISKFFGRLLLLLVVALVCIGVSYIGDIESHSTWFVIFIKILIPITLFSFSIGYGFKIVAFKCDLCNNNMFNMIRESI